MRFKSYEYFTKRARPGKMMLSEASSPFSSQWPNNAKIHKYRYRGRPAKMMLSEASSPFAYQWLDNVKIHRYAKFEPNAPRGSRIMSIFTTRARPAKLVLGEASSPFCIPAAR